MIDRKPVYVKRHMLSMCVCIGTHTCRTLSVCVCVRITTFSFPPYFSHRWILSDSVSVSLCLYFALSLIVISSPILFLSLTISIPRVRALFHAQARVLSYSFPISCMCSCYRTVPLTT